MPAPLTISSSTLFPHPTHCNPSFGPSPHPSRSQHPCKICFLDILPSEPSLTHNQEPCFIAFHTDCLNQWLPHATHVPPAPSPTSGFRILGAAKFHPCCPNCRGSLGEYGYLEFEEQEEMNPTNPQYGFPPVSPMRLHGFAEEEEMRVLQEVVGEFDYGPSYAPSYPPSFEVPRSPSHSPNSQNSLLSSQYPHNRSTLIDGEEVFLSPPSTVLLNAEPEIQLEPATEMAPYAIPVESLDEIRQIVGDEAFFSVPLGERRHRRPVHFRRIPVRNGEDLTSATEEGYAQQEEEEYLDLYNTTQSFSSGNALSLPIDLPSDPREAVRILFPPTPSTSPQQQHLTHPPPPSIHELFRHLHRSYGVSHWEAYHFPSSHDPHLDSTQFYIPIYPTIQPLPSLTALRRITYQSRAYSDPDFPGTWLRSPVIHSPSAIHDMVSSQGSPQCSEVMEEVSAGLPAYLSLTGWSLYLPSSIHHSTLTNPVVYAIPRVAVSISLLPRENQESAHALLHRLGRSNLTGFLLENGCVDVGAYFLSRNPMPAQLENIRRRGAEAEAEAELRALERAEVRMDDGAFQREMLAGVGLGGGGGNGEFAVILDCGGGSV